MINQACLNPYCSNYFSERSNKKYCSLKCKNQHQRMKVKQHHSGLFQHLKKIKNAETLLTVIKEARGNSGSAIVSKNMLMELNFPFETPMRVMKNPTTGKTIKYYGDHGIEPINASETEFVIRKLHPVQNSNQDVVRTGSQLVNVIKETVDSSEEDYGLLTLAILDY